ncbi:hypothetical protein J8N05_14720 [Streptomyces sp. BH-SS-21]|uniref:Uncharacterized protein n=1 Tax=Streptomyces liliiviolaceus TaxID=2823109 RepID=A0A940XS02_9ACTN|nr:hypothetical protein [Streptomyces liliiviolaceus]MBQ0849452.1 hypothetical protein [Streptomyces liliiviolaceus]
MKLASRHTNVVIPALAESYARMDPRLHGTLTWDRGMELSAHKQLSTDTGIEGFFAAPGNSAPLSPGQSGASIRPERFTLSSGYRHGMRLTDFGEKDLAVASPYAGQLGAYDTPTSV